MTRPKVVSRRSQPGTVQARTAESRGQIWPCAYLDRKIASIPTELMVKSTVARTMGRLLTAGSSDDRIAWRGLARAVAVDYGPAGIRANAVAVGSVSTSRYGTLLDQQGPDAADRTHEQMALLHSLGRVGRVEEVAAAVAYLL